MAVDIYVILFCYLLSTSLAAPRTNQFQLAEDILDNYKPALIPILDAKDNLKVEIAFILSRVQILDEKTQTLVSLGHLKLRWVDQLLKWDPASYGNITSLELLPDDIWLPEIQVYNSVEQPEDIALAETMKFRVQVTYEGVVTWSPAQQWNTFCHVDMTFFPFDEQVCDISIANLLNQDQNAVQLDIMTDKVAIQVSGNGPTTGEWTLQKAVAFKETSDIAQSGDTNDMVTMRIKVSRASEFYVYNVILPVVITSQASVLVYMLPSQCGEKIGFNITMLLTYFVLLLMVSELMPRSGNVVPHITSYICLCMFLKAISLLLTVFVLNIFHHHPYSRAPKWLRHIFFGCCHRVFCFGLPYRVQVQEQAEEEDMMEEELQADVVVLSSPDAHNGTATSDFRDSMEAQPSRRNNGVEEPTIEAMDADYINIAKKKKKNPSNKPQTDSIDIERNREEWEALSVVMDRVILIFSATLITTITVFFFMFVKVLAVSTSDIEDWFKI